MSSIAQELCDEIEESVQLSLEDVLNKCSRNKKHCHERNRNKVSKSEARSPQPKSLYIVKKKAVNKLIPNENAVIHQFRSKEIITQKSHTLRDNGVNTLMSGPIKSNKDCLTVIRARDRRPCKCSPKRGRKVDEDKETQTNIFNYVNKASSGHIITCNNSTQCNIDEHKIQTNSPTQSEGPKENIKTNSPIRSLKELNQLSSEVTNQLYKRLPEYINKLRKSYPEYIEEINRSLEYTRNDLKKFTQNSKELNHIHEYININDNHELNPEFYRPRRNKETNSTRDRMEGTTETSFMGARKWAMSKYLTRGPDF